MFLTVHTSVGALIGQNSKSAIWAFIFGLILHFLLDIIPHGDHDLLPKERTREKMKNFFAIASIDAVIVIIYISLLFSNNVFHYPQIVALAIFGSVLPDLLNGFYELTGTYFLKSFHQFHEYIHALVKFKIPFWPALILQIIIFIIIQIKIL